jgi:hypothetical protein
VHVANRGSEDVDSGRLDELFGFCRRCEIDDFVPSAFLLRREGNILLMDGKALMPYNSALEVDS